MRSGTQAARSHLLATQPYEATFGKKHSRKRPRLAAEDVADLVSRTRARTETHVPLQLPLPLHLHLSPRFPSRAPLLDCRERRMPNSRARARAEMCVSPHPLPRYILSTLIFLVALDFDLFRLKLWTLSTGRLVNCAAYSLEVRSHHTQMTDTKSIPSRTLSSGYQRSVWLPL